MASVNSSSSTSSNVFNTLGFTNKGIGGLASGLNTDELVTALISGTSSKISKQTQQRQLLNWQMTGYRSAATQLRAFQSKHFSYTSAANTNIMSSGFWNTYKATSSSSKVSATATANSTIGSVTIDKVQQLASAETLTSKNKLSTELTLNNFADDKNIGANAFSGQTLKLDVNGSVKTIKLDDLNEFIDGSGNLDFGMTNGSGQTFEDKLQELVDKSFGTKGVWNETDGKYDYVSNVEVSLADDNKTIKLNSDSAKIIVANSTTADLNFLGVKEGASNRIDMKTTIGEMFKDLKSDFLTFSINGTEISVGKDDTLTTLMSKIKSSDAGVDLTYSAYTDEFTLTAKTTGAGENIVVEDVYGDLMNQLFGAKSAGGVGSGYLTVSGNAVSQDVGSLFNTINNSASGSEAMKTLGSSLKYMAFEMTVDGETKTVRVDTSVIKASDLQDGTFTESDVYNAINKGIRNAFTGTSVQLGAEYDLYDESTGVRITATPDDKGVIAHNGTWIDTTGREVDQYGNKVAYLDGQKLVYNKDDSNWYLDDVDSGQVLSKGTDVDSGETYWYYNDGTDDVRVDVNSAEERFIASSKWTGHTNIYGNGSAVTVEGGGVMPLLGFTGATGNIASGFAPLSGLSNGMNITGGGLTINGRQVSFGVDGDSNPITTYGADMTIDQFVNAINDTFADGSVVASYENGNLSINAKDGNIEISDTGSVLEDLFGITGGTYETADQESYGNRHKAGSNAEVVIDGKVLSYASNTFTINGIEITVNEKSEAGDPKITVGVVSDVDDVVSRIKDWMADYNALVYSLNSMINEGKNSDYAPLTDEQRAEMTEDQITKWETEAKKGILRNDSTLKSILSELRQSLYEKVEAAGISLYDIGITTKAYGYSDANEAGQICFDEIVSGGGEEKLRSMLESNPDKVRLLFTDSTNGLAVKMNNIITQASNESSINRGSLVNLAGTEKSTGNNTSVLDDKISALDKYVATLKVRLENEYTRYWKKFSALEVAVQKLSVQSSWFSQ